MFRRVVVVLALVVFALSAVLAGCRKGGTTVDASKEAKGNVKPSGAVQPKAD